MARLFLLALATPPAAAAPQSQRQLSLSLSDLVLPPWSLMKVAYCKFFDALLLTRRVSVLMHCWQLMHETTPRHLLQIIAGGGGSQPSCHSYM